MGYVFQEHRLLPWKTVKENIVFAMKAEGVPAEECVNHTPAGCWVYTNNPFFCLNELYDNDIFPEIV
jgi:hypothetical protein